MECSLPGSSIHGIFQARVLEWGAITFSAREALKYKNTVSQKTSYRDTELQIQVLTVLKVSKGGKEARLKEGEKAGEGEKGVVLRTSLAACRYPRVMGLYPGPPEKGRLELGPTRNQTRPEPEFEFSAKRR